jgi:hypothetical protein
MSHTIDSFIKELQSISEDKRKLPLVVYAPNGVKFSPSIKMGFDGHGSPLLGDKLVEMVISWRD